MKRPFAVAILPKAVLDSINRSIEPHLRERASGDGICSNKTARERRLHIHAAFADLWVLGYSVKNPESLCKKHINALMVYWEARGRSANYLHNKLSVLRTLAGWLNKQQIVQNLTDYFPRERTRRKTATEVNRAWEANEVDAESVIEKAKTVDMRLAVMLAMQHCFGLRVKESVEFQPSNAAIEGGKVIEIHEGTKGGRPRHIPVETDAQRKTLAWARDVVAAGNSKRLRWPDRTWRRAQNHFYYLIRSKLGISKALCKVTAHGLRHGYSHRSYERRTGFPVPIVLVAGETGGKPVPPVGLSVEAHRDASLSVSRALGHGRIDVTTSYYGTYGHSLRGHCAAAPAIQAVITGESKQLMFF